MNAFQYRYPVSAGIEVFNPVISLKAFFLLIVVLCLAACNDEGEPLISTAPEQRQLISEESADPAATNEVQAVAIEQFSVDPVVIPLMAGQHIEVGTITVANSEDSITVVYETFDGWSITETHLDVALDYSGLATNKPGNPLPGKFDFQTSHPAPVNLVTYEVDSIEWESGMTIYVATHAVVTSQQGTETAWAGDLEFPGSSWATYFTYVTQEANSNPQGTLQFSQPIYFTDELGRSRKNLVVIEVERVGGSSGTISAIYNIVGGTATNLDDDPENGDYAVESSAGVLEFADGEILKTISIIILDDNDYEFPNETILLELRDSCCLGSQASTIVDITDDDELN